MKTWNQVKPGHYCILVGNTVVLQEKFGTRAEADKRAAELTKSMAKVFVCRIVGEVGNVDAAAEPLQQITVNVYIDGKKVTG